MVIETYSLVLYGIGLLFVLGIWFQPVRLIKLCLTALIAVYCYSAVHDHAARSDFARQCVKILANPVPNDPGDLLQKLGCELARENRQ
jgi:hypothetical protein